MYAIIGSAFCYVAPFWYKPLWPLMFLFPALLYANPPKKLCLSIFLWSIIASIGHIAPVAAALYRMAHGPIILKCIPGIFLISYGLILTVVCIWPVFIYQNNIIRTLSLWMYFMIVEYAAFAPFGKMEGTPFLSPFIVLPAPLLTFLPIIGMPSMLLLFCITTTLISLSFSQKRFWFMVITLLPWALSPLLHKKNKSIEKYSQQIAYLPTIFKTDSSSYLQFFLNQIAQSHPQIKTVILPESACPHPPQVHSTINLIVGSFQEYQTTRFNIVCLIQKNICYTFAKTHSMLFGESLPNALDNWLFNALYFAHTKPIKASINKRPRWALSDDLYIVPYICSELFLAHNNHNGYEPIVFICNDWWFNMPHYQQLMVQTAQLKAIMWCRPIIYVSYFHGLFFDEFGNPYSLEQL